MSEEQETSNSLGNLPKFSKKPPTNGGGRRQSQSLAANPNPDSITISIPGLSPNTRSNWQMQRKGSFISKNMSTVMKSNSQNEIQLPNLLIGNMPKEDGTASRRGSLLGDVPPSAGRRESLSVPSSANARRGSIGTGRRGSIQVGGFARPLFDEDALKMFFNVRGVSLEDIDIAFEMLSQDKEKITHADIKLFISNYFDWFPEEAMTVLNSWKEEVTKAQLVEVLINKNLMTSPYEAAFKVSRKSQVIELNIL